MMMVALIMRPWILLMRASGGVQWLILADDVLIIATGKRMIGQFAKVLNVTHKYLQAMGAKVAPSKTCNIACSKKATK